MSRRHWTDAAIPEQQLFETAIPPDFPAATRVNGREAYPGIILPLDLTVVAIPNDHGIRRGLRDLGIRSHYPAELMVNRVHLGRFYVNLSWVMWQADLLPFTDPADWEAQLFGSTGTFLIARPAVTPGERLRVALATPRLAFHMLRAVIGRRARLERNLARRAALDLRALGDRDLAALIEPYQHELERACGWLTRGSFVSVYLVSFLTAVAGGDRMQHLVAALSDLGEVESAAPALRIRAIADRMRADHPGQIAQFLAAPDRLAWLRATLPAIAGEIDALLARYGYRSTAEFMITRPSWAEEPKPVLDALAGLVGQPAQAPRAARPDSDPLGPLLAGLPGWRRALLRLLVRGAHLGGRTREESKGNLILRVDMLRALFREIGVRLARSGALESAEEIGYLTLHEVGRALREPGQSLRASIAPRRAEAVRLDALPEPPELMQGLEEVRLSDGAALSVGAVLGGQGVSGGAVEGLARVVDTTAALDFFEPGEILVAAFTDAGWTPYFTMAAGVVGETGGLLTHTSVVARELGLPAVVGVRDVTGLLRTGDRIRLDPAAGTVELLARAA